MKKYYAADCETNPFKYGDTIAPFIWAIHDGQQTTIFDGVNATKNFIDHIRNIDGVIYAHNGGRFDWMFSEIFAAINKNENIILINNRIAKAKIGKAELRDSFLILPAPLASFAKDDFDYSMLEEKNRTKFDKEIKAYITSDVVNLYAAIDNYITMYGMQLTQGATAMKEWGKLGGVKRRYGAKHDETFRPFYFGGRCEVFKYCNGVEKDWKVYDVNSAYPYAMTKHHCVGNVNTYTKSNDIADMKGSTFWEVVAVSRGALPLRDEKGGVTFPNDNTPRKYFCTGWEIEAGVDTGTLDVISGIGLIPSELETFSPYVTKFKEAKENAKKGSFEYVIAKIFLNTLYGKYATDITKFRDYKIVKDVATPADIAGGWLEHSFHEGGTILKRPSDTGEYFDVAVAASITGHARAELWRGICASENVAYCDTDSLFCAASNVNVGDSFGEWDLEDEGKRLWVAGKKLYCMEKTNGDYKTASKGVRANPKEIKKACAGEVVEIKQDAPVFKIGGGQVKMRRKIKIT